MTRHRIILFVLMLLGGLLVLPPCASAQLRFRTDGTFKIVQFTDMHYNGTAKGEPALDCIDKLIDMEKPDLVVLTGDIIYAAPAKDMLTKVLDRLARHNVPWAYQFGNHDWEQGATNRELYALARTVRNNVMPQIPEGKDLDYVLPVYSHDGKRQAATLYCLDSHAYPEGFPQDRSKGTYAWFNRAQIDWYSAQSAAVAKANGGKLLPALAFFHIPLPEWHYANADENCVMIGERMEAACSPDFNSGMFTAMLESGDVMGVFTGHDHDNDYSVMYHGILLAYGRYSGGNTEYNHLPNGARVIVLKEGKRGFDTYIRERKSGAVVYPTTYPDNYVKGESPNND